MQNASFIKHNCKRTVGRGGTSPLYYNFNSGIKKLFYDTVLKFPMNVTTIIETTNEVLLASGKVIYKWSEEFYLDDEIPISYRLKLKDVIAGNEMLVESIDTKFGSDRAGVAILSTSTLKIEVPTNSRKKIWCSIA